MSLGLLVACFSASIIAAGAQSVESRLVNIAQGPVRGYKEPGSDLFSFYNIPYATASRYKPPAAPPSWSEPFEAIDRRVRCPQRGMNANQMQEDCLIANVFVPDTNETNLPVLVNIHGGGFRLGSGNMERLTTFSMSKNIITVTFNYRIYIIGFLCLGTENVPGNAGMKDQVALLRWVKQNIANFGGNPNDVTITACSAGAVSANLLTLSETAKGLFNKVISNSGAGVGALAVQMDPLQNAKNSAKILNFTGDVDDMDALEEFYMTASLDLLTSYTFTGNENSTAIFGPCVERDTGGEMFLSEAPYNMLRSGDYLRYPTLYGVTDMEGLNRIGRFSSWIDGMNEKFSDFLPADLQFESEEQKDDVAKAVKEFYFGTQPITNDSVLLFVDYFTDVVFAYPMMFNTKLHYEAGNNTIYLYEYSFFDENTSPVIGTNVRGATHCSQAYAVFDADETNITEERRQMRRIMSDIWANFIRTGQPLLENSSLPAWPPVGANRSPHLSLGREIELKDSLSEQRGRLWDDLYERYYRRPVPPQDANYTNSAIINKNTCLAYLSIIIFTCFWNKE